MWGSLFNFVKAIWNILNSPNNDPIIVALIIAFFASLFVNIRNFLNCRTRIKDKDKRIEDLVEERNKFQDIVLKSKGIDRKSSKNGL